MATPAELAVLFKADPSVVIDAKEKMSAEWEDAKGRLGGLGKAGKIAGGLIAGGLAAAGLAAGAMAAEFVGAASEQQQAINQLQADLGITKAEAEELGDVGLRVFKNNWGESITEANAAVGEARKMFRDLNDNELQGVVEQAFAIRDAFGVEVTESYAAAQRMAGAFHMTEQQAMDMLARGIQVTGEEGQELSLLFKEYSAHLAQLGFQGPDVLSAIQSGLQAGAFEGDKVLDMFKEMNIKMTEGSDATKDALGRLGLDPSIIESYRSGELSGVQMFQKIQDAIKNYEGNIPADLLADTLGTPAEDLGAEVVRALDLSGQAVGDFEGRAMAAGDAINNNLGAAWANLKRSVIGGLVGAGQGGPFAGLKQQGIDALNSLASLTDDFFEGLAIGAEYGSGPLQLIADGLYNVEGALPAGPVKDFVGTLIGGFEQAQDVWDNLSSAFESGGIQGVIEELVGVDIQPFLDVWGEVKSVVVDTVIPGAISILGRLKDEVLPAVMTGVSGLADTVNTTIVPAWRDEVMPLIQRFNDEILPKLISLLEGPAVDALKSLVEGGLEGLRTALEVVGPLIIQVGAWLIDNLGSAFSMVLDVARPILTFLADHKTLLLAVAAVIATVTTGGIPAFILAIAAIGKVFGDLKGWLSDLKEDWQRKWDEIKSKVTDIDLKQAAIDIVQGLLDGLQEKWEDVKSWAADAADELLGVFDLGFEIFSPARTMIRRGLRLMEGLGLGIQFGGATAREAMEQALQDLQAAIAYELERERLFFEQTGGLGFEEAMAKEQEAIDKIKEQLAGNLQWLKDQHDQFKLARSADLELGGEAADDARARIEAHKIQTEALIKQQRQIADEQIRRHEEEMERIRVDHQAWQEAIAAREEAYRRAQNMIKEAQRAEQERAKQIHEQAMRHLQEHRDARVEFWKSELARAEHTHEFNVRVLENQQRKWEDYIAEREERLDDMKLRLEGLKLDLNIPAQEAALDAAIQRLTLVETQLDRIREVADSFEILPTDPREENKLAYARVREKTRAITDEQKAMLRQALSSGLLDPEQQKMVELMLLGHKARAADVAEIFELMAEHQEKQVEAAQKLVTAEQQKLQHLHDIIAAEERRIELAEHELNLERDRVDEILAGISDRLDAEKRRYETEKVHIEQLRDADLDAIDEVMKAQERRHREEMDRIAAEFAYRMALLDHTEEEIDALIRRAQEVSDRITADARARADSALAGAGEDAISTGQAWGDTMISGAVEWGEHVSAAGDEVERATGAADRFMTGAVEKSERMRTIWGDIAKKFSENSPFDVFAEKGERRQMTPELRQLMMSGKRGSGGFRVGDASWRSWREWHWGTGDDETAPFPAEGVESTGKQFTWPTADELKKPFEVIPVAAGAAYKAVRENFLEPMKMDLEGLSFQLEDLAEWLKELGMPGGGSGGQVPPGKGGGIQPVAVPVQKNYYQYGDNNFYGSDDGFDGIWGP